MSKSFAIGGWRTRQVLCNVSFRVEEGARFGLLGETGSGKTTIALLAAGLLRPTSGQVLFRGEDLWDGQGLRTVRSDVRVVFQDAHGSLNPRMRVAEIVAEPARALQLASGDLMRSIRAACRRAQLRSHLLRRKSAQLSGGEKRRVNLARALLGMPRLLILDEPMHSIDFDTQEQIADALLKAHSADNVTLFVIAHDVGLVDRLCDCVVVIERGQVIAQGPTEQVLSDTSNSRVKRLVQAYLVLHGMQSQKTGP